MKTFFLCIYFSIPKRRWQSVGHSGTGGFYFLLYAFFPPYNSHTSAVQQGEIKVSLKRRSFLPRTGLVRQESFERGQGMGVRGFRPRGGVRDLNKENL